MSDRRNLVRRLKRADEKCVTAPQQAVRDRSAVIRECYEAGMTLREISDALGGRDLMSIAQWIRDAGGTLRNPGRPRKTL